MSEAPTGPASSSGEPSAVWTAPEFADLYAQHSRAVYYLALRFLGDPQKAEDAVQDVFIRAFGSLRHFRGEASARTWLYRIAINHCQNVAKSWYARHIRTQADESAWEGTAARTDSPLRVLKTKELGQRIQSTLDGLPDEYRLLLLLVADEELSYEEIAVLVGQSADAVRGKLHRARKAFAARFTETPDLHRP